MAGFLKRSLYRSVSRQGQRAAQRAWQQTDAAKLVGTTRSGYQSGARIGNLLPALEYLNTHSKGPEVIKLLRSSDAGSLVGEIARYSKSGGVDKLIIDQFLQSLGPAGTLLKKLVSVATSGPRRQDPQPDLDAARSLLEAFGYEVLPPPGRETADDLNRGVAAAREYLEQRGFEVTDKTGSQAKGSPAGADDPAGQAPRRQPDGQPGPERPFPQGIPRQRADGRDRKVVDLDLDGSGPKRRFPVGHPIVTKEPILTPESSNVHSFRYDIDTSTLYVRYLQAAKGASPGSREKGPLYGYSNVPPNVFLAMMQAPSKGAFVWDNLRIRGTVSGQPVRLPACCCTGWQRASQGDTHARRRSVSWPHGAGATRSG